MRKLTIYFSSYAIHPKETMFNPLKTFTKLTHLCSSYMGISLSICSDPAIHRCSTRSFFEKSRKFYSRTPIKKKLCYKCFPANFINFLEQIFHTTRPSDYSCFPI